MELSPSETGQDKVMSRTCIEHYPYAMFDNTDQLQKSYRTVALCKLFTFMCRSKNSQSITQIENAVSKYIALSMKSDSVLLNW